MSDKLSGLRFLGATALLTGGAMLGERLYSSMNPERGEALEYQPAAAAAPLEPCNYKTTKQAEQPAASIPHPGIPGFIYKELPVIRKCAEKTGAPLELLLAMRCAERGRLGREFGYLSRKGPPKGQSTLEWQATEAGEFVRAYLTFWKMDMTPADRREYGNSFIRFLGDEGWCPVGASNDPHGLNKNWVSNVTIYADTFRKAGFASYHPE